MKHKLLSILLCLAMALSLLPTAALAEEATGAGPIKVGETSYSSFSDAVNAAEPDESGVITYKISGKVDVTDIGWVQVAKAGLPDLSKVEFVGITDDAEICITQGVAILADQSYDIDVSFEALKLTKLNPQWAGDFGHSTNYFTCWLRNTGRAENTVTYTNCTFPNGVCNNQYGKTVFNNCQFTNSANYNLWNYGGNTEVKNSAFIGVRGIKTYNEGTLAVAPTVKIEQTTFSGLTEKAAIVASKATDITLTNVTATGCTKGLLQKDIEGSSADQKVTIEANGTGISGDFNITANKAPEAAKNEFNITAGTFPEGINNDYLAPGANFDATTGEVKMSYVAKIGDTEYPTLADAIYEANTGDTVKLVNNVTENVTIPAAKTITLDLNGMTLTNVDDHTILNNGNLTIMGTGRVDNISHAKGALYNKGTVVINGGTFDRSRENGMNKGESGQNSWYTIKNVGTMTINDGATVQTAGNNAALGKFSSLVSNGYFNANDYNTNKGLDQPILTIDGGTFRGGLNTIKNDDRARLTINGGTFSNYYQAVVQNHNIAEITGGTFTAASDANTETYGIYNCGCGAGIDLGTLTVSGGTFTGATYAVAEVSSQNAIVNISGGQFAGTKAAIIKRSTSNATIAISGGTFSSDPSVYVVGNGNTNIVKRDGSEGAYTYTVLAKSGLTSGVYLTNPSGALASNYYVSSTANGVWTVSYSAPYSGGSSSYDPTYSVSTPSKTEHGTVTVSPKSASKGDTVTVTVKPDSGYVLETLTVTDKNGNELTLKDKGNGKYTFTMPAGKVEVKATFMEDNSMLNFFYDVPNNAYFYEAVKWAVENGITTGVGNDLFAPEQPCTRAQIVTFLWRAAGSPEPKSMSSFSDVSADSYYAKAVAWAVENGITTGTGDGKFSPDATCTRAQSVTFLFRAIGKLVDSKAEFSDVLTDSYYANAVAWAVENGVTNGIGDGLFGPDNSCTRAQIVTFLFRAYQGK